MSFESDLLEKIEAEILRRADGSFVESFSEGGTSVQSMSLTDLLRERDRLKRVVEKKPDFVRLRVRPPA